MTELNALQLVYNYRHEPEPLAVPPILSFTWQERLLFDRRTAIPWSGIVDGFCERHPECYAMWRGMHRETIEQAIRIVKDRASKASPLWAVHLTFRWFLLGSDACAWALLTMAHSASKENATAAQNCIQRICTGFELTDSRGMTPRDGSQTSLGHLEFPDMRKQILELNEEFRVMTIVQRRLPFASLPFSREFLLSRSQSEPRRAPQLQEWVQ